MLTVGIVELLLLRRKQRHGVFQNMIEKKSTKILVKFLEKRVNVEDEKFNTNNKIK
jgi:hypothetical protein